MRIKIRHIPGNCICIIKERFLYYISYNRKITVWNWYYVVLWDEVGYIWYNMVNNWDGVVYVEGKMMKNWDGMFILNEKLRGIRDEGLSLPPNSSYILPPLPKNLLKHLIKLFNNSYNKYIKTFLKLFNKYRNFIGYFKKYGKIS